MKPLQMGRDLHEAADVPGRQSLRAGRQDMPGLTLAELRGRAGRENATLEDVYLQLVGEGAA